ncbi:MAG: 1-deoxy-D-xylulose-5-phosphate reductoisomerase, partial [Clostridia bacterium]|nr:1-deoxy-D-xylulose-5-phosphate reductoisomerase [Clostridia bacterium]
MINVCILGSTGSIGVQTLNVVRRYPDKFRVVALVCGSNADILLAQAKEFKPSFVGLSDKTQAHKLDGLDCTVYAGEDAQEVAATLTEVDVVVASVVGLAGLKGVVAAIKAKKKVALANKETLVACGEYIT